MNRELIRRALIGARTLEEFEAQLAELCFGGATAAALEHLGTTIICGALTVTVILKVTVRVRRERRKVVRQIEHAKHHLIPKDFHKWVHLGRSYD